MKKILTSLTAMVLLLTGCGAEDSDALVVWAMGEEGNTLAEMAAIYTEETGVEVEVVAIPWDQAHDKLTTAVASGTGPDVVQLGTSWVAEFADAGALADLSAYSTTHENFNADLYFEGSQETMYYEDTLYTIPWYVDTRVLYYRTDILAETCGLEGAPTTWEEMSECSVKLADRGEGKYAISYDIKDQFFFIQFAWQNGWEIMDENGNINFNDPLFIEAMEYAYTFVENGSTNLNNDLDITQTFADGTFPMFISGPWMVNVINETTPDLQGSYSIAQLPAGPAGSASLMGGSNLAIWETSEKKDEAADFINWLVAPEQQKTWYEMQGSLPSQVSVWDDEEFLASGFEMETWKAALEDAKVPPTIPEWETIAQEVVSAQEAVMVTGQDPAEVAAELQTKVDEILSE